MKRWLFAVAIAAVASIAVAAAASAKVDRIQDTQGTTQTLVATVNGTYVHTYTITFGTNGSSFTGTSSVDGWWGPETINGTFDGTTLRFHAVYNANPAYTWDYSGPLSGGPGQDSTGQTFNVALSGLTAPSTSDFKNHGEYVSSMGGGAAAAQSTIGMPVNSNGK
jgi:hypothetical protein